MQKNSANLRASLRVPLRLKSYDFKQNCTKPLDMFLNVHGNRWIMGQYA